MFLEILLFMFLGICLGVLTGIIPSLHPNSIFVILLSFPFMVSGLPFELVLTFIVSVSVTTTFVDFIPSLLLGAPDPDTSLSVLPGHRFLLEGRGYEALVLTVIGGIGVTVLTVLTLPLLLVGLPLIYSLLKSYIHIILVVFVVWLILSERGIAKIYSLVIFLLAGFFGLIVLNSVSPNISVYAGLTGLFGLSGIVSSYMTNTILPKQKTSFEIKISKKGIVTGWFAGLIAGILPGLGSAQSSIIASRVFSSKSKDFLVALGGINTANIIFTFIVLFTLDKTRSGATWFVSQLGSLSFTDVLLAVLVSLVSAFVAGILTLKIGRIFTQKMAEFNYRKINLAVLAFVLVLSFMFTGFLGLFISIAGMFIGLLAISLRIRRSQLIAFLLLPTILYFSGLNSFVVGLLF